jgi:exodeoxyribonuclease VII large subunit
VPVVLAPAAVQGAQAPAELVAALNALYVLAERGEVDVILLVRGGGSIEDLWAFNDEQLARTIARSPVPLISGVGHETDFTIADFCADVRAPTPTAAAELAAQPRDAWLGALAYSGERLHAAFQRRIDIGAQRLDAASSRLGRPLGRLAEQGSRLERAVQRLRYSTLSRLDKERARGASADGTLRRTLARRADQAMHSLDRMRIRLESLDPRLVLKRGYALLTDEQGAAVTSAAQTHPGQPLRAILADGEVALIVTPPT